jgi:trimethylamine---corrinoid protein Co-methyltransferase
MNMGESRRRSRRRRQGRAIESAAAKTGHYRQLKHPFQPQKVFSDDEINAIHQTALQVLEELGLKILLPEARDILATGGAIVKEDMVYIGRDMVESALATAPTSIRLRAANPVREQIYENGALIFVAGSGCPNVTDLERGRRPGSMEAFEESLKLCQSFDVIHKFGPSVEPQDIPVNLRHYATMRAQLVLGDKPTYVFARGRGQVEDSFEIIRRGLNLTDQEFENGVWASTVINTNSPRMLDLPMAQGIIDFARAGQMTIVTPFCLAGAMAPITVAGALTLQHAEALAGITLAQMTRAGAPVSYGGFSSNVDMKSGAPAFGTPEHVKLQLGSGQLARLTGLPWRSATGSASNIPDMQAATETDMALWGAMMANATLVIHSAGWLEGGLSFGYEKFINDVEALQILAELCRPTEASVAEIGLDALRDVEPGGHFFATQHTMDRYQNAFYRPLVADLRNFGAWSDAGSQTSAERATGIWKRVLRDFEPPENSALIAERVAGFIEDRKAAGGASPLD